MSIVDSHDDFERIAVIGMSCRFPGAATIAQFWENLAAGIESVTTFTPDDLRAAGVDPKVMKHPQYVNKGAVVDDIEYFDAGFFGYNPREAELIDPQQRLLLEVAWEALEDGGYDPRRYPGLIGVYASAGMSRYLFNIYSNPDLVALVGAFQVMLGNDKDHVSTRIAYKLDLKGPAVTVQTACSSSLVAVCLGCDTLLNYQSDLVLAGGVSLNIPQRLGYMYATGGIASSDGHCRAFDARAEGTITGNGAGMVLLKRLSDALTDGDPIRAIIRGVATNNDGSTKVGYTAPSIEGQSQVIATALSMAGVEPETIDYIEAHGTGTRLGDPIEVAALTKVFHAATPKKQFCALGSVKTNIGHLDPAAGVAGLIKAVLALEHRAIPPSLHFVEPNPEIDFENSPFYVNNTLLSWPHNGHPRRAGVSSFGMGGTNAHVILEEAPETVRSGQARPWQLLSLSGRSEEALAMATAQLADHLRDHPQLFLGDVAYTCQVGRRAWPHRRIVACRNSQDVVQMLTSPDPRRVFSGVYDGQKRPVVFMFSGQGSQHVNMGSDLYRDEPLFRETVDRCAEHLKPLLGRDLRDLLYPPPERTEEAAKALQQTAMTQPAVFVISYALAQLLLSWGVKPAAMIGHSIGEYVAACLAGVFTLKDALTMITMRGRLMQQLAPGAMLAISLAEGEVNDLLDGEISIAAANAPLQTVVSGPFEAISKLEDRLKVSGIPSQRLRTSHAFHSATMEPMLIPFLDEVRRIALQPPQIAYIANVTGNWITATQATDPNYWAQHVRRPVRFGPGIERLLEEADPVLLQVGPGTALSSLAQLHLGANGPPMALPTMRHPRDTQSDMATLLTALGRLWIGGAVESWDGFYEGQHRQRVSLPTYPFTRQRYWIDPPQVAGRPKPVQSESGAGKAAEIAEWFYIPHWRQSRVVTAKESRGEHWLIFGKNDELLAELVSQLQADGVEVVTVSPGEHFAENQPQHLAIRPRHREDYTALLSLLRSREQLPDKIVHLWSIGPLGAEKDSVAAFGEAQSWGFYSLLFLAQALGELVFTQPMEVFAVSSDMQAVTGEEALQPEKATLLGACRVMPQEYPNIVCRSIDFTIAAGATGVDRRAGVDQLPLAQLLAEVCSGDPEPVVAYRGGRRWIQAFEAVPIARSEEVTPLRSGGVYLITGGLGRIGRTLGHYLAETVQANLILVGRSAFPAPEEWDKWLADHDEKNSTSRVIRELQQMESHGGKVLVLSGDVSDPTAVRQIVAEATQRFGEINGVIHAAGFTGPSSSRSIQEISQSECERHFAPKAHALYGLEEALAGQPLDFCLLFSSLSSVLGGLGFVAYAAANLFMDAYAQRCYHARSLPWLSVNWDGWRFDSGRAAVAGAGTALTELAIRPEEGAEAFRRVLTDAPQVVVSTGPLQPRIEQWVKLESLRVKPDEPVQAGGHNRPELKTSYVAPRNAREHTIASLWGSLLGIDPIGIHDNFFELGGHSLLAIQLISRLRTTFQIEVPVQALFDSPTVAQLACVVEEQERTAEAEMEKLAEMLELVESLSDEELQALLDEKDEDGQGRAV